MKCAQVKKRLVDLLAGECTPSEEMKIRSHLLYCSRCARELEDLKAVDSLLDSLEPEKEPPDLYGSIMEQVETLISRNRSKTSHAGAGHGRRPGRSFVPDMLRDMAAAAAVALAVFWLGTGWFGQLTSATEGKISGAVLDYVHYTGVAMDRAQSSMSAINSDLFNNMDKFSLPKTFKHGSDQK